MTWSPQATLYSGPISLGTGGPLSLTTDGLGNWLAAWSSDGGTGTDDDIFVSHSTDNGATWGSPDTLNANAATDSGWDWLTDVATDGLGHWVAVWVSTENLGGTGTDEDIFVSTSTDLVTTAVREWGLWR